MAGFSTHALEGGPSIAREDQISRKLTVWGDQIFRDRPTFSNHSHQHSVYQFFQSMVYNNVVLVNQN